MVKWLLRLGIVGCLCDIGGEFRPEFPYISGCEA